MSAAETLPPRWEITEPGVYPGMPAGSQLITFAEVEQRTEGWSAQRLGIVTSSVVGRLVSVRNVMSSEVPCPACGASALSPCRSKVRRGGELGAPIKQAHPERVSAAASLDDDASRVIEPATGDDARSLAAYLAAERISGFSEDGHVSFKMQRGIECEPLAIEKYSEHYRVPVASCGFMVRNWGPFRLGYSPDGLVGDDGLVEVKTRDGKKQVITVINDQVPPENMAQLQAGLLVSGRKWIDYISYSGGLRLWTKRIYPDPQWFAAIAAAVRACEGTITSMVAAYDKGTAGMPMTERLETEMDLSWT